MYSCLLAFKVSWAPGVSFNRRSRVPRSVRVLFDSWLEYLDFSTDVVTFMPLYFYDRIDGAGEILIFAIGFMTLLGRVVSICF